MLYIVATPIGNLKDITLRALETLESVDGIICEDSRRTSILLNHYSIKKPMLVINDFNEAKMVSQIIEQLKSGKNLALVSDAGTPLIADPGYKLVRACIMDENIPVDSIPGSTSIITALTLSSFPPYHFTFIHYPPEKTKARLDLFEELQYIRQKFGSTYIMLIPPHKLVYILEDMEKVFSNIYVVLAKELTKIHQDVKGKFINEWFEEFKTKKPKGEYIILFSLLTPLKESKRLAKFA